MNEKIRVMIVDDHPMVIAGMKAILHQINYVQLAATATNAIEAIAALKQTPIDVAFVDINLPEISGIELTLKIKREFPKVRVLALSTINEPSVVAQMLQNGAIGYLTKSASPEEMEAALLNAWEGKQHISPGLATGKDTKSGLPHIPIISRREKEVLKLIADGLTSPQIALNLFISLHTVDTHRKNLLAKFEVNNTAGLIKMAARYDMI